MCVCFPGPGLVGLGSCCIGPKGGLAVRSCFQLGATVQKGHAVHWQRSNSALTIFTDFLGAFRTKGGSILMFSLQQISFVFLLYFLRTFFKPAALQTKTSANLPSSTKPHWVLHHILSLAKKFRKIKCNNAASLTNKNSPQFINATASVKSCCHYVIVHKISPILFYIGSLH